MEKTYLFISLCLVLVISGVIAYVYIGPKGSDGNNNPTDGNSSLTERVDKIESRLSEQLVLSDGVWYMNNQTITFKITHIGTACPVNISEIRVSNVLNSSSPGWEGVNILAPGHVVEITLYGLKYFTDGFTNENCHPIMVNTTNGNTFYLYAMTFTFVGE